MAKERARNAKEEQEHAEEAEELTLQRMHALEASGMQVCSVGREVCSVGRERAYILCR